MAANKVAAQKAAVAAAKFSGTAAPAKGVFGLKTIQRNDMVKELGAITAAGGDIRFILPNGGSWNTYDVIYFTK